MCGSEKNDNDNNCNGNNSSDNSSTSTNTNTNTINNINNGDDAAAADYSNENITKKIASRDCYGRRGRLMMMHVRPGPKGAEKAVTFVVQSLVPKNGRAATIRVRLDCTESVNASPLPGSSGLSREV